MGSNPTLSASRLPLQLIGQRRPDQAPFVAALAAAHLRCGDEAESRISAAAAAGRLLAELLGFGQDLLVAHEAVDPGHDRDGDQRRVCDQPERRAPVAEFLDAGRNGDEAEHAAHEPGMPLDQPAFVPAREAEAADAVGGFHAGIITYNDRGGPPRIAAW